MEYCILALGILVIGFHFKGEIDKKSAINKEAEKRANMSPDELLAHNNKLKWGEVNSPYICPHCHERGNVHTMPVDRKRGISGAKATGAILTGGVSLLATGLSKKDGVTQAHCTNCNCTWDF